MVSGGRSQARLEREAEKQRLEQEERARQQEAAERKREVGFFFFEHEARGW